MAIQKKYGTIDQKIIEYETIAKFYERNADKRFQTKSNLRNIVNEISLELEKTPIERHFNRLDSLYNRIKKFI